MDCFYVSANLHSITLIILLNTNSYNFISPVDEHDLSLPQCDMRAKTLLYTKKLNNST